MTSRKLKQLTASLLVAFTALLTATCGHDSVDSLDLESYQPVDKFVPAYEAIHRQADLQEGQDYDLEKTVRVLNALEIAQANSKNFNEFLEYMARQDYSNVAPDVLEAKQKLLPVLQYMYKLQQQDEDLDDMWMLVRSAATGGKALVKNKSVGDALLAISNPLAVLGILHQEDAERSTSEAFSSYEADKKLKRSLRQDIERLRESYTRYLSDYAPIYHKYMNEYDAMCIDKDKAYLDLYGGRTDQALAHADNILRKYPRNAEAMLLRSMALILLGSAENVPQPQQLTTDSEVLLPDTMPKHPATANALWASAQATLQEYIHLYPDRTAPAMVLQGLLRQQAGDEQGAMQCFNQASIEYPRQAAQLTDMLDAYNTRAYLTKTPEGQYLRRLYASTMEGYGLFSPNLLKAKHYADQGKMQQSKEEIYNHFFRRGNQGIYDELLSDMQFCEEHLYASFKQLLLEQSYIDISISPQRSWLFWNSDNVVRVSINNRSDVDLENVRIFLCIHYTDMYKDEYDVVKVPKTMNVIPRHTAADLDTVVLRYQDKTYHDITRIRAIAMTDDRICWVDDVDYKQARAAAFMRGERDKGQQAEQARKEYLSSYSLNPQKLRKTLAEGLVVLPPEEDPGVEKNWWEALLGWFSSPDNDLKMELPRVFSMLSPVFSLHPLNSDEALMPSENYLSGTTIHLQFDCKPTYGEQLPLYIYSDFVSFKATITYQGKDSRVDSVDIIGQ